MDQTVEIRLDCLRLAVAARDVDLSANAILTNAKLWCAWIEEGEGTEPEAEQ